MKVLAKDAKAGQWYDTIDGDRHLCIRGTRMANEAGVIFLLKYDAVLIHLPDCTGWDWQPPKPEPKYRPFATWQEWWPHRDRWVRWGLDRMKFCWRGPVTADEHFKQGCFFLKDDGTDAEPFGVEATE